MSPGTGGVVAKYGPPILTAIAMFDWVLAISILFGFLAGWAGAASLFDEGAGAKRKMWARLRTSLLASGIGLLIVLWAVRLLHLDALGAATVAAGVGVLGVNAVEIFRNGMRNWLRSFVQTATDALGDQRQEVAKSQAARRFAAKLDEAEEQEAAQMLAALEERERLVRGEDKE